MPEPEVSAAIGAMILSAAERAGVDRPTLQRLTGFSPEPEDPDARIPLRVESALWDHAAELSGDGAFGMHTALTLAPGTFDVLDYAIRTAPTLRDALQRFARYNRIVHDVAVVQLLERSGQVRVEHSLGGFAQSRHAAEFTMTSVIAVGGQLCGVPLQALAVEFHHTAPSADVVIEHARFFGVTPSYGSNVNTVTLSSDALDREVVSADAALSRIMERHAAAMLAALPEPGENFGDRVRRLLVKGLAEDTSFTKLGNIAARLHMSERSLQRRLSAEGVSFDALLDGTRKDLARQYLRDHSIAIAEVAFLLGYSEPSAFHRAFKRWTGETPAQARTRAA
jgi:AraC-like DNA-binding protein